MVPNKRSKAKNAKIQVIGCYEISSRKSQRSTALGNKKQLISEDSTLSRAPLSVYFARSVLKRRYFFGVSATSGKTSPQDFALFGLILRYWGRISV